MSLLDGRLAASFASMFSASYLDGTLTKVVQQRYAGGDVVETTTDVPCKLQVDRVTEASRSNPAFTNAEVRILVLAAPLGAVTVTSDDRITATAGPYAGVTWKLNSPIGRDPAGIGYDCAGVRA